MRRFIESHVGLVMLLSCIAGLFMPGLPAIPDNSFAIMLAVLIFFSCYKLRDGGFSGLHWRGIANFYALRYLLLPPLAWLVAEAIVPQYATAILLLTAMPTAVASPAFASIFGGATAPAFVLAVVGLLLSPLLVPMHFMLLPGVQGMPAPMHLFTTLVLCVIVPMLLYRLIRSHRRSAHYFYTQSTLISLLTVSLMIAVAVSKVRHIILADPAAMLLPLTVVTSCYALYIVFGWFAGRGEHATRVSFTTCSGFNNIGLAISLALLHFSPEVILFMALGEISWSLLPMMMRFFLRFLPR